MRGAVGIAVLFAAVLSCSGLVRASGDDDDNTQPVEHYWVFQDNDEVHYTHMAMITTLPNNTIAVAFQESSIGEGCNDQSIFFTTSTDGGATWSNHSVIASDQYAVWGPVLFFDESQGNLWLFYTQSTEYQFRNDTTCGALGHSYPGGQIMYKVSADLGSSWSTPVTLMTFEDRGHIGKMTANLMLVTANGSWVLPFWQEAHTVYDLVPDCSGVLISLDNGSTWNDYGCIANNHTWLIENTVAETRNGSILQLFRTTTGFIYQSWSHDGGFIWTNATATELLNPNAKVCMFNREDNGDLILAYNPSSTNRNPLALATSSDGTEWDQFVILASNASLQESYPTPFQIGSDVYTVYTDSTSNGIMLAVTALPDSL